MADEQHISSQKELLHTCRKTLSFAIQRAVVHGGLALAPPEVRHTIDEMQIQIGQIKADLRAAGVVVDDEQFDDPDQLVVILSKVPEPLPDPNRAMMIDVVRKTWINTRLERALSEQVRLTLNLVERPDAVELPLNAQYQEFAGSPRPLPSDTQPIKVFDEAIGTLLILGAPGAGKTTMMLELARELLNRAEADRRQPIPVVFNLSSWAQHRSPLDKWLITELHRQYKVHPQIGTQWIREDALVLLLDGLDEVREESRAACVEAINSFRQDHGLVRIIVCSRLADYEALQVKLKLYGAVLIQPLTLVQVENYLEQRGEQLVALRQHLHNDATLQELATTPLMLYVMSIAYADVPSEEFDGPTNQKEWRKQLFDRYIERMFDRGAKSTHYTREQTVEWLSWLARQMHKHNLTIFSLEDLQPDWLTNRLRWWYGLVLPVAVGLIVGLCIRLVDDQAPAVLWGIGAMLGVQLGLDINQINQRDTQIWTWRDLLGWSLRISLCIGLSFSILMLSVPMFFFSTIAFIVPTFSAIVLLLRLHNLINRMTKRSLISINIELFIGFSVALSIFCGLIIMLAVIVAFSNENQMKTIMSVVLKEGLPIKFIGSIFIGLGIPSSLMINLFASVQLAERLKWSWIAAIVGLLLGLLIGSIYDHSTMIRYGLIFMVITAASGYKQEFNSRLKPNEGFWRSLRNTFWSIICGFILAVLLIAGALAQLINPEDIVPSVIVVVLVVGVRGGLAGCIQHLLIRLMLASAQLFPHAAVNFLDEAVTRILMRKVGGSYMFLHRSLLDYFDANISRSKST